MNNNKNTLIIVTIAVLLTYFFYKSLLSSFFRPKGVVYFIYSPDDDVWLCEVSDDREDSAVEYGYYVFFDSFNKLEKVTYYEKTFYNKIENWCEESSINVCEKSYEEEKLSEWKNSDIYSNVRYTRGSSAQKGSSLSVYADLEAAGLEKHEFELGMKKNEVVDRFKKDSITCMEMN